MAATASPFSTKLGTSPLGDLLSAKNIPWKYYGGRYNVSGTGAPLDGLYCNICNPFEYQLNYPACEPITCVT